MKIKDHLESDGSILTRGIREWSREDRWPYGCLSRARYDLHSSCKRGLWHRPESEVPRRRTLVTKPSWGLSARRVRLCCSCDKSIEHPVLHGTPSTILTPHPTENHFRESPSRAICRGCSLPSNSPSRSSSSVLVAHLAHPTPTNLTKHAERTRLEETKRSYHC